LPISAVSDAGGDHYRIHTEGNRSTLYIPSVRPDDDAWYQCTAASVSGTATNRVRLQVIIHGQLTLLVRLGSTHTSTFFSWWSQSRC